MSAVIYLIQILTDSTEYVLYLDLICRLYRQKKKKQMIVAAILCACMGTLICRLNHFGVMCLLIKCMVVCIGGWYLVREESFGILSMTLFASVLKRSWKLFGMAVLFQERFLGMRADAVLDSEGRIQIGFLLGTWAVEMVALVLCRRTVARMSLVKSKMLKVFFVAVAGIICYEQVLDIVWNWELRAGLKWSLILLAGLVIAFFVLLLDLDLSGKKQRIETETMKRELLEEKYQSLNEMYNRNAKLYHDLNNHLNTLYQLLEENRVQEAKGYISDISEPIQSMRKITWTGVELIDVVLNSKAQMMRDRHLTCQINAEFWKDAGILETDVCTVLSNLVDNAIEAAEKLPRQESDIKITMRKIQKFLLIQVENPCIQTELPERGLPETSKKEKGLHGWGLQNVADVAEKYQGTFQCTCEKGIFCASVMLFFNPVKEDKSKPWID